MSGMGASVQRGPPSVAAVAGPEKRKGRETFVFPALALLPANDAGYGFGAAASTFARLRRRRAASACFLRRLTLGFM